MVRCLIALVSTLEEAETQIHVSWNIPHLAAASAHRLILPDLSPMLYIRHCIN